MTTKNNGFKVNQAKTHTFSIDFTSVTDDTRYSGQFTCKKLTIADMSALGVRKAQLNGGMYYDEKNIGRGVDESTDQFNNMIAHLELAIIKAPAWWDFDKMSDINLLGKVFEEVMKFESSFFRDRGEASISNGSGSVRSGENNQGSNSGGDSRSVVEQEISSALEP